MLGAKNQSPTNSSNTAVFNVVFYLGIRGKILLREMLMPKKKIPIKLCVSFQYCMDGMMWKKRCGNFWTWLSA
jgi:hypothetical protein